MLTTSNNTHDSHRLSSTMDSQQPLPLSNPDAPSNDSAPNMTSTLNSSNTPPSGPPNKAKSLSCGTCRERKVRCDKNQPCSTCQRAKVPCVFPSAKRLPRKRQGERKKTNEKLLQRLNRLEALVEKAGLDEKEDTPVKKEKEGQPVKKEKKSPTLSNGSSPADFGNGDYAEKRRERSGTSQSSGSQPAGKSAVEGEMSRYLSSNFWASLSEEVSLTSR